MNKPNMRNFNKFARITLQRYERYLPTAFDESLTLLEKMNKLIEYLNAMGVQLNDVVEQWNEVMEWIINDGITDTVLERLDEMVEDGTFEQLINETIFNELETRITGVEDELEQLNTLPAQVEDIENKLNFLTVNIKDFGAVGDGGTDDTQALRDAISHVDNNGGGRILIPEGVYHTSGTVNVPSNIVIEGYGNGSIFKRSDQSWLFNIQGSTGQEYRLLQDAQLGDHSLTVSNISQFNENDYIKVMSQRNAFSIEDNTDDYYLGQATNSQTSNPHRLYFGEFLKISQINEGDNRIFFRGGLVFPDYLTHNNDEIDKGDRTHSTVAKVNFVEKVVFKNLTFDGDYSNVIRFDTVRDCRVVDCHWVNAYEHNFVTFHNSLDCFAKDCSVDYTADYTPPTDYIRNPFKTVSTVNCGFDNVRVSYGTQCVDFTYSTADASIPNQNSYLINSKMVYPIYDGITIHPGTINARVVNNTFSYCRADGIFNRSKKALISNNVLTGSEGGLPGGVTWGVKVTHDSMQGSIVSNNIIDGFSVGAGTRDNINTEIKEVDLTIHNNVFSRINIGIQLRRGSGSNFTGNSNVRITHNTFKHFVGEYGKCVDIHNHYHNIFIEHNMFMMNDSTNAGIYTRGNVSKVFVNNNQFLGYPQANNLLWFGEITNTDIPSRRFEFKDNRGEGIRLNVENMRTANLNNADESQNGHIRPHVSNVYSLGSPSYRWRYLYTMNNPDVYSDRRLKENISDEHYGLNEVMQMKPKTYQMDDRLQHGLIAQELKEVIRDGAIINMNDDGYYSLEHNQLIPILIKAIQELNDKIERG